MSEFHVEVVRLGPIEKHPNADTLGITQVHGGYPVIVKLGDFREGDLAVYIPVDALVDGDRPEFKWLGEGKKHRIRAKKIRGVFSMGLLIKVHSPAFEGESCADYYGVEKYVPKSEQEPVVKAKRQSVNHEQEKATWQTAAIILCVFIAAGALTGHWAATVIYGTAVVFLSAISVTSRRRMNRPPQVPVYDIEGYRKHKHLFKEGEPVCITEKIHGCNAKFVYQNGRLHCGSRNQFRYDDNNLWARAAKKYGLEKKLKKHPGLVLYGEIYGEKCQDLHYGVRGDDVGFAAFDAMNLKTGKYLNVREFVILTDKLDIPCVPFLSVGPWDESLLKLAEGETLMPARHVREGIVIKPMIEQEVPHFGRKFLKFVGQGYLLRP